MKYVASLEYYFNCRCCDSGTYSGLKFFRSIKKIVTFALKNKADYELRTIYSCKTGEELFELWYKLGKHSCTGISLKYKRFNIRTQDDGRGNLLWVKQ